MNKYIMAMYGFGPIPEGIANSRGKALLEDFHKRISPEVYGNTVVHMIQLYLPDKPMLMPSKFEFDINFLSIVFNQTIREAGHKLRNIESIMYNKSLEEGVLGIGSYKSFIENTGHPIRVYAKDFQNAIPIMDDALEYLRGNISILGN